MGAILDVLARLKDIGAETAELRTAGALRFWHSDEARLALVITAAVVVAVLVLRSTIVRRRWDGILRVHFLTSSKSKRSGSSTSGSDEKVRGFVPDR